MIKNLTVLIAFLMTIGTLVSADPFKEGDVFFCQTDGLVDFAKENNWKLKQYGSQKFKFQIKDQKLKFGEEGYFANTSEDISFMAQEIVRAKGKYDIFVLDGNRFIFTAAYSAGPVMMVGTCDKF